MGYDKGYYEGLEGAFMIRTELWEYLPVLR